MFVVATAGHVDHGKSTLVRALTGMEPDRWAEERRRGLTIDLGFAWTTLPSGRDVAFVDVPGHARFLGNMLAGLGPAPVVCFVVAADQGWRAQSDDHRDAVAALGIEHGLIVLSRLDLAPDGVADVLDQVRGGLAGTGLRDAPAVAVSATTGEGLESLRTTLDGVLAAIPEPVVTGRVRIWVDRSFSSTGAGTVVTGTLSAGTVAVGDRLDVLGRNGIRPVVVRGLQSQRRPEPILGPVNRVALNLRGVTAGDIGRGDVLLTAGAWPVTRLLDVRRSTGRPFTDAPEQVTVHVGSASVPARLRPFDDDHARLGLDRDLPLTIDDRLVLRHPGTRRILGGVRVLDADPPAIARRGDGRRRAATLASMRPRGDVLIEVARRGAVSEQRLRLLGLLPEHGGIPADPAIRTPDPPAGIRVSQGWWIHDAAHLAWRNRLRDAVSQLYESDELTAGLSRGAAADLLALPDISLLDEVIADADLEQDGGRIRLAGSRGRLGAAEVGIGELESRLAAAPFRSPAAEDLIALHLGARELAAAVRAGRLLRLTDGVVLLPGAPAMAIGELSTLDQPFTTSQARQALDTTRRVVIPLLEHLDARGWTRRLDAGHREVVRRPT